MPDSFLKIGSTITFTANEVRALFAAVHYVDQELNHDRVRVYHKILDRRTLYPGLVDKFDKLRSEIN